jgi:hypothetical protein
MLQLFIIQSFFLAYGKGSKIIYGIVIGTLSVVAWLALNPSYFPDTILENSIIVQMILSKYCFI